MRRRKGIPDSHDRFTGANIFAVCFFGVSSRPQVTHSNSFAVTSLPHPGQCRP
jgi:hypothetical protein